MFSIAEKIALITGGASGLGFMFAQELLKSGLKAVTLVDINEEFGKKALNDIRRQFGENRAIFVKADVRDRNQFEDAFIKTIDTFKNVDILINNAGVLDEHEWEKEVSVNLNGTINGTLLGIQNYIQNYKSSFEGVIVNVSSVAGADPMEVIPIYTATKSAIIALTRSFATKLHYKLSNVRVFSICPGFTKTSLMVDLEKKALKIEYADYYINHGDTIIKQEPEEVSCHIVELVEKAPSGSVWVIEDKQPPYMIKYLSRRTHQKV